MEIRSSSFSSFDDIGPLGSEENVNFWKLFLRQWNAEVVLKYGQNPNLVLLVRAPDSTGLEEAMVGGPCRPWAFVVNWADMVHSSDKWKALLEGSTSTMPSPWMFCIVKITGFEHTLGLKFFLQDRHEGRITFKNEDRLAEVYSIAMFCEAYECWGLAGRYRRDMIEMVFTPQIQAILKSQGVVIEANRVWQMLVISDTFGAMEQHKLVAYKAISTLFHEDFWSMVPQLGHMVVNGTRPFVYYMALIQFYRCLVKDLGHEAPEDGRSKKCCTVSHPMCVVVRKIWLVKLLRGALYAEKDRPGLTWRALYDTLQTGQVFGTMCPRVLARMAPEAEAAAHCHCPTSNFKTHGGHLAAIDEVRNQALPRREDMMASEDGAIVGCWGINFQDCYDREFYTKSMGYFIEMVYADKDCACQDHLEVCNVGKEGFKNPGPRGPWLLPCSLATMMALWKTKREVYLLENKDRCPERLQLVTQNHSRSMLERASRLETMKGEAAERIR